MGEFGAAHQSTLIDPQKAMPSPPEKGRASTIDHGWVTGQGD